MEKPARRSLVGAAHDGGTVDIVTVGRTLGNHYRLVREVARGGMGIVYEAEDLMLEGRRVAVKVLPPELSKDEAAILRLKREASAVSALDHPNVVRLIEFNADASCHYLVMEYLDGDNLAVHLAREGRLPLDAVLRITREVGAALAFAHRQNVLHRDVKPSNVVFKTVGDDTVAKLTDFGIAWQVRDSMTRLTGQESAGTLTYLAPEQLRGKRPSPASDQYSLAATVYELLVGEPPFSGGALSQQILEGTPEPVPDVPEAVNAALLRGLAKDPAERHPDVAVFVAALAEPVPPVSAGGQTPSHHTPVPAPEAAASLPALPELRQPGPDLRPPPGAADQEGAWLGVRPSLAVVALCGASLGLLAGWAARFEGAPPDSMAVFTIASIAVALFSWLVGPPLRRRPLSLGLSTLAIATGVALWPFDVEGFHLNLIVGLLTACVALAALVDAFVGTPLRSRLGRAAGVVTVLLTVGGTLGWMVAMPVQGSLRLGELIPVLLLITAACVPFLLTPRSRS